MVEPAPLTVPVPLPDDVPPKVAELIDIALPLRIASDPVRVLPATTVVSPLVVAPLLSTSSGDAAAVLPLMVSVGDDVNVPPLTVSVPSLKLNDPVEVSSDCAVIAPAVSSVRVPEL